MTKVVLRHFHDRPNHLVNSRDDLEHLLTCDKSVAVQVVHCECPFEFLLQLPTGGHRERAKELPEVDAAVGVGVKSAENVLGKFRRIAVRKEVAVYFLEFFHAELAVRTILKKALVPFLDLSVRKLGVGSKVLQDLWLQLAVLLSHFARLICEILYHNLV